MEMKPVLSKEGVDWLIEVAETGDTITFRFREIRRERTGIHALVAILSQETILGYDTFNIGRREDRQRLGNAAYKVLPANGLLQQALPLNQFNHQLDLAALQTPRLWEEERIHVVAYSDEADPGPVDFVLKPYIIRGGGTILYAPPKSGKALDDDTPVLTTDGWKRHGALVAGDEVFGRDGLPTAIIATRRNAPRPSMIVRFSDGEALIADEQHGWIVESDRETYRAWNPITRRSQHTGRREEVLETRYLLQGQRRAPAVRVAAPISLPEKPLPIDPYLLGIWLGDGISSTGSIAVGEQDIEYFRQYGKPCKAKERDGYWRVTPPLMVRALRTMGILGHKRKCIPLVYHTASYAQRLALLQGIMDTDGYVSSSKYGQCELVTVSPTLAEDYIRLIASLGLKVSCRASLAKLNGRVTGPRWRLCFFPLAHMPIFRLPRKFVAQIPPKGERTHRRYIVGVEPAGLRTMQCIEVVGGVYLAGRALIPTHNSYLGQAMAITIATGRDTIWPTNEFESVLYVNLERDGAGFLRRELGLKKALKLTSPTGVHYLHARGMGLNPLQRKIRDWLQEHPESGVFLDSVSRAQAGGSLNEDETGNRFIDMMNGLEPAWWVAIAHTPRADATHIFGSIMFEAGMDIGVKVSSETRENILGLRLEITAANDIGKFPPQYLAFEFEADDSPVVGIRTACLGEFPELLEQEAIGPIAKIKMAIDDSAAGHLAGAEIAKITGLDPGNVARYLRDTKVFVALPKQGKTRPYGLISRL